MPGEQDLSGLLAKEKLAERERQEFTEKIDAIDRKVEGLRKSQEGIFKKVGEQIQSIAVSKGDSETLKKWDSLTEAEKQVSPLIPRNAYETQLQAIFSDTENIPGLKRRVKEILSKEDLEALLTEDSSGEKTADLLCTNESCRTKVKERVETFSKEHGLKKQGGLFS